MSVLLQRSLHPGIVESQAFECVLQLHFPCRDTWTRSTLLPKFNSTSRTRQSRPTLVADRLLWSRLLIPCSPPLAAMPSACGRLHPILAQVAAPPSLASCPPSLPLLTSPLLFRIHCLSFVSGRARVGRPGSADMGSDIQGFFLVLAAQI